MYLLGGGGGSGSTGVASSMYCIGFPSLVRTVENSPIFSVASPLEVVKWTGSVRSPSSVTTLEMSIVAGAGVGTGVGRGVATAVGAGVPVGVGNGVEVGIGVGIAAGAGPPIGSGATVNELVVDEKVWFPEST